MFLRKVRGPMVSLGSHTSDPGSNLGRVFSLNSAAATSRSSEICNLIFFQQFFPPLATKQAISIKLVTTVIHFYVTLTLQAFIIWLAHLVVF